VPPGPDDEPRASGGNGRDDEPAIDDPLIESAEPSDDRQGHTALPPKVESWRKRSATGAILTGFALGLQQVFEPKKDEPAVIMETSGEPPKDLPVEADFEYGRPKQSIVNVRPWLLPSAQGDRAAQAEPADGAEGTRDNGDRDA
jgi:hypothetical protein